MVRGIALYVVVAAVLAAAVFAGLAATVGGRSPAYVVRLDLPRDTPQIGLPAIEGPDDPSRPLVVIDPGHGGHDPGASGAGTLKEAQLTLALARAIRDELVRRARVRVALTRDGDKFLALEERSGIARRLNADLFVSIHADAATEDTAQGATLYTLSEKASDAVAAQLAARENNADKVNGVRLREQPDDVAAILLDLSRRQTQERSSEFAQLALREARGVLQFRPDPLKSAAFVVLKSADVPSVLFETGYISNSGDAAKLTDPAARARFAEAAAQAIEVYFARTRGS